MPSRVALIIVTYNGEQYAEDLFRSLAVDAFPKDRLGIFVVDNASTDNTVQEITQFSSRVSPPSSRAESRDLVITLIRNTTNTGFAAGNNIAIRRALADGYEWIALLNQDTVVKSGWVEELLRVGETDPRIGAVQPLLALWPPERGEINSLGNEIHFLGFGLSRGYHDPINEPVIARPRRGRGNPDSGDCFASLAMTSSEITYASGAAVLYRAAALLDVGLFNEEFFMYHEDLDLGWRLWLRGWKSVLAPNAVVYHKYDFKAAAYKYYYMERNRLIVLLQNYKLATLVLLAPAYMLMELGLLGFSVIKGWWKEKLRGYWWVILHAGIILKTRAAIQKSRTASDGLITARFVGSISYQEIDNPILRFVVNPAYSLLWSLLFHLIFW